MHCGVLFGVDRRDTVALGDLGSVVGRRTVGNLILEGSGVVTLISPDRSPIILQSGVGREGTERSLGSFVGDPCSLYLAVTVSA